MLAEIASGLICLEVRDSGSRSADFLKLRPLLDVAASDKELSVSLLGVPRGAKTRFHRPLFRFLNKLVILVYPS
jgi:hypothetical protein